MTLAPTPVHPGSGRHRSPWLAVLLAFLLGGLTVALLYHFDAIGGSSASPTEGSGRQATQIRHVPAFDRLELSGSNNVVIGLGTKQSVVVRGDDNLLDRVTTRVRSGTLVVGNSPGGFTTRSPMSVHVTVPALDAVTLAGSGNIVVDDVRAKSLEISLPGSGTLTGSGSAGRLDVTVGGTGTAQFTRLVASDVRAVVSGSGSIFVTATSSLAATVSGTGSILYSGNPRHVAQNVTGTGTIVAAG